MPVRPGRSVIVIVSRGFQVTSDLSLCCTGMNILCVSRMVVHRDPLFVFVHLGYDRMVWTVSNWMLIFSCCISNRRLHWKMELGDKTWSGLYKCYIVDHMARLDRGVFLMQSQQFQPLRAAESLDLWRYHCCSIFDPLWFSCLVPTGPQHCSYLSECRTSPWVVYCLFTWCSFICHNYWSCYAFPLKIREILSFKKHPDPVHCCSCCFWICQAHFAGHSL